MKKNILAIFTICMLVMTLSSPVMVMAAEDHGGEAHSPSMSVESGEEPIADMSTTQDTGKVDAGDVLGEPDPDEAAAEEEQAEQPIEDVEEAKDLAKGSLLKGMKKMLADNPAIWIAGIAVIGIGSVVVEILATKRRQKNGGKPVKKSGSDKHYKGKH